MKKFSSFVCTTIGFLFFDANALSATGPLVQLNANSNASYVRFTPVPQHEYAHAGYRIIDSAGVNFLNTTPEVNGFYSMSMSPQQPFSLFYSPIQGSTESKRPIIEVCLNVSGHQPIGCERTTLDLVAGTNTFLTVGYKQVRTTSTFSAGALFQDAEGFTAATKSLYAFYSSDIASNDWTASAIPSQAAVFENIACNSDVTSCFAVGRVNDATNYRIESYVAQSTNAGQTWSAVTLPDAATSSNIASYSAISCSSDGTTCHSIANLYDTSVANTTPMDLTYSSNVWSVNTSFTLLTNGLSYMARGMQCAASGGSECVAVGTYIDSTEASRTDTSFPLVMKLSGGAWTAYTFDLPSGATQVFLNDIACNYNASTLSTCIAVGSITTGSPEANQPAVFYSTNGGTVWSKSSVPALPGTGFSGELSSISCSTDASTCMVAGWYQTGSDDTSNAMMPMTLQSTNSGVSWQYTTSLPTLSSDDSYLTGISCGGTSMNTCTVVGVYGSGTRSPLSFTTTNFGSSWTENSPAKSSGIQANLRGLQCDSSTGVICASVGGSVSDPVFSLTSISKQLFGLVTPQSIPTIYQSSDSGKSFTPLDDSSGLFGALNAIASIDKRISIAVGSAYLQNQPTMKPLVKRIVDGIVSTTLLPSDGLGQLYALGQALPSGVLFAVGDVSKVASSPLPLIYSSGDSGVIWTKDSLPPIDVDESATLSSIQCIESNTCFSFGSRKSLGSPLSPYVLGNDGGVWVEVTPPQPVQTVSGPVDTALTSSVSYGSRGALLVLGETKLTDVIQPVVYGFLPPAQFTQPKLLVLPKLIREANLKQVMCPSSSQNCYAIGSMSLSNGLTPPLFINIKQGSMDMSQVELPILSGASGLVLDSTSCNLPDQIVCTIMARAIINGRYIPVSLTSYDSGETWGYNGGLGLPTSLSFIFNASTSF